jgi:outer membrane protein TolC
MGFANTGSPNQTQAKLPSFEVHPELLEAPAKAAKEIANLDELLALVRSVPARVQFARGEQRSAQGQAQQALGAFLPRARATGKPMYDAPLDSTVPLPPGFDAPRDAQSLQNQLSVTTPVFAPSRLLDWQAARLGAQASESELHRTQQETLVRILQASLEVQRTHKSAMLFRSGYKDALVRVDLAQRRVDNGDATILDLLRVQQDAENSRAALVASDGQLWRAYEDLGRELGLYQPTSFKNLDLDVTKALGPFCRKRQEGEGNADVEAAQRRLALADKRVASADWSALPTLDAQALATHAVNREGSTLGVAVLGVVTVPVFDWTAFAGQRIAARGERDKAITARDMALGELGTTVRVSARDVLAADRVRDVRLSAQRLAASAEALAQANYDNGWVTSFELITAAAQRRQAEQDLLNANYEALRTHIASSVAQGFCSWD